MGQKQPYLSQLVTFSPSFTLFERDCDVIINNETSRLIRRKLNKNHASNEHNGKKTQIIRKTVVYRRILHQNQFIWRSIY